MARHPRSVDQAIARFDDLVHRLDGSPVGGSAVRGYSRTVRSVGKRVASIGAALAILIVATIGFALIVGPIGLTGLFVVVVLTLLILLFFGLRPIEPKRVEYNDQLPTKTVVQQLDSMLARRRTALPAPAARRVDAISQQLPLLESRLAEVNELDPLAQDAKRLMGKHLPDLIERYERVPAQYRSEKDGEGLSVDERLVSGLDAARQALDEIGAKLAREDVSAFQTQGRFIESRYKDGDSIGGE
jgi:hypothetical protein